MKNYKENKIDDKPNPPYYKPKDSKFNFKYLNNGFKIKDNKLRLSIPAQLKKYLREEYSLSPKFLWVEIPDFLLAEGKFFEEIKLIEIKPLRNGNYKIIIIIEVLDSKIKEDNGNYLGIDIGINNLMSCYDNHQQQSFIISGSQYLSINRYFDKKIKYYQSILNGQGKKTSSRIESLYRQRRRQLNHLLHAATKKIVDYCRINNISRVIIGDIKKIRQNANLGKKNNQKLHKLPFDKLYKLLEYKLALAGILLIKKNEKYTSQCSPYTPKVSKKYAQKKNRVKRGLYVDQKKEIAINADIVGAYNILRKYLQQRKKGPKIKLKPQGLTNTKKYSWNNQQFIA